MDGTIGHLSKHSHGPQRGWPNASFPASRRRTPFALPCLAQHLDQGGGCPQQATVPAGGTDELYAQWQTATAREQRERERRQATQGPQSTEHGIAGRTQSFRCNAGSRGCDDGVIGIEDAGESGGDTPSLVESRKVIDRAYCFCVRKKLAHGCTGLAVRAAGSEIWHQVHR